MFHTLGLVDLLVDNWAEADSSSAMFLADFDTWLPIGPITPAIAGTGFGTLVGQTGQHTYKTRRSHYQDSTVIAVILAGVTSKRLQNRPFLVPK